MLSAGESDHYTVHFDPTYDFLGTFFEGLTFGVMIDGLSAVMLVVVSFISLLVQIYSMGYMKGDPGYHRYFAAMSLFTMAMLGVVLSSNLAQVLGLSRANTCQKCLAARACTTGYAHRESCGRGDRFAEKIAVLAETWYDLTPMCPQVLERGTDGDFDDDRIASFVHLHLRGWFGREKRAPVAIAIGKIDQSRQNHCRRHDRKHQTDRK